MRLIFDAKPETQNQLDWMRPFDWSLVDFNDGKETELPVREIRITIRPGEPVTLDVARIDLNGKTGNSLDYPETYERYFLARPNTDYTTDVEFKAIKIDEELDQIP